VALNNADAAQRELKSSSNKATKASTRSAKAPSGTKAPRFSGGGVKSAKSAKAGGTKSEKARRVEILM
jgi:hypothetical protein